MVNPSIFRFYSIFDYVLRFDENRTKDAVDIVTFLFRIQNKFQKLLLLDYSSILLFFYWINFLKLRENSVRLFFEEGVLIYVYKLDSILQVDWTVTDLIGLLPPFDCAESA